MLSKSHTHVGETDHGVGNLNEVTLACFILCFSSSFLSFGVLGWSLYGGKCGLSSCMIVDALSFLRCLLLFNERITSKHDIGTTSSFDVTGEDKTGRPGSVAACT